MKKVHFNLSVILFALITVLSCASGDENPSKTVPTVTTSNDDAFISPSSRSRGGNVTSDGGTAVTSRGVVWSTSSSPTIALSTKTTDGAGVGSFLSSMTGLLEKRTEYYVRAYATNTVGTAYGDEHVFTTGIEHLPAMSTTYIANITTNSAISGGEIYDDGSLPITARGIVWSATQYPTIALSTKTADGTGKGMFTSNMINLVQNTTYYVRAYATNAIGTAYGSEIKFTTAPIPVIATLTTKALRLITTKTALSGGTITSNGFATVTATGVCWSTKPNATVALTTKTLDGSSSSGFFSRIIGLTPATTYYLRAYATNAVGTAYGQEETFTTQIANGTITIGAQIWQSTNLDVTTYSDGTPIPQVTDPNAWKGLTTGAWCYFNNDSANGNTYGKLYNWYAVAGIYNVASKTNPALRKQFAPIGWHVPSANEWTTLTTFLGQVPDMKEAGTSHWKSPNLDANNDSGFTGLPGSYRLASSGSFMSLGEDGYWWSTTVYDTYYAYGLSLFYNGGGPNRIGNIQGDGLSVRCIKN